MNSSLTLEESCLAWLLQSSFRVPDPSDERPSVSISVDVLSMSSHFPLLANLFFTPSEAESLILSCLKRIHPHVTKVNLIPKTLPSSTDPHHLLRFQPSLVIVHGFFHPTPNSDIHKLYPTHSTHATISHLPPFTSISVLCPASVKIPQSNGVYVSVTGTIQMARDHFLTPTISASSVLRPYPSVPVVPLLQLESFSPMQFLSSITGGYCPLTGLSLLLSIVSSFLTNASIMSRINVSFHSSQIPLVRQLAKLSNYSSLYYPRIHLEEWTSNGIVVIYDLEKIGSSEVDNLLKSSCCVWGCESDVMNNFDIFANHFSKISSPQIDISGFSSFHQDSAPISPSNFDMISSWLHTASSIPTQLSAQAQERVVSGFNDLLLKGAPVFAVESFATAVCCHGALRGKSVVDDVDVDSVIELFSSTLLS
ncbi:hypothetical protein GEMRC1_001885 [Eukaryota sp. GEM-RC1]